MNTLAVDPTITGLGFLWLEITGKCNLTCTHCYADSGPLKPLHGEMRVDDWERVLAQASELGCHKVQFIGGEPTLHPHLQFLIASARSSGFDFIEVYTNASRLNSALVGCFNKFGVHVASSFYSNDSVVHDRITGAGGSWERTVRGLKTLVEAGVDTRIGIILMEENLSHVDDTTKFLRQIGIGRINSDRLRGVGRGQARLAVPEVSEFGELCGQCWKQRLCVTNMGEAFPCVFSRTFPMGNVLDADLSTIVNGEALLDFRHRLKGSQSFINAGCAPNCNPECQPGEDCAPKWCRPDDGSCSPNDPDPDCGPYDR